MNQDVESGRVPQSSYIDLLAKTRSAPCIGSAESSPPLPLKFASGWTWTKTPAFRSGKISILGRPRGTSESTSSSRLSPELYAQRDTCRRLGRTDAKRFLKQPCFGKGCVYPKPVYLETGDEKRICAKLYVAARQGVLNAASSSLAKICQKGYHHSCTRWIDLGRQSQAVATTSGDKAASEA